MIDFDPGVHTPNALLQELDQVRETAPGALVIGSLGRAAYYNHALGDPTYEYRSRQQLPLQTFLGGAADIDLLEGPGSDDELQPFEIDSLTMHGRQVTIEREDGVWYLGSPNRGFRAAVDPAVFEPVATETVYRASCNTVPAQTHLALLGINGTLRPQDITARRLLTEIIEQPGFAAIPAEAYEPFEELRELNRKSLFTRTRAAYRGLVPASIRRPLAPLLQPVKDHFLR